MTVHLLPESCIYGDLFKLVASLWRSCFWLGFFWSCLRGLMVLFWACLWLLQSFWRKLVRMSVSYPGWKRDRQRTSLRVWTFFDRLLERFKANHPNNYLQLSVGDSSRLACWRSGVLILTTHTVLLLQRALCLACRARPPPHVSCPCRTRLPLTTFCEKSVFNIWWRGPGVFSMLE